MVPHVLGPLELYRLLCTIKEELEELSLLKIVLHIDIAVQRF